MSISIDILENGMGVEFYVRGVVTGAEIIQARKLIETSYSIAKYKYYIVNQSLCTEYDVTADDIVTIAEMDVHAAKIKLNIIMAVIESKYLKFSLTEAWYAYVEDHICTMKSFKDRSLALIWIEEHLHN